MSDSPVDLSSGLFGGGAMQRRLPRTDPTKFDALPAADVPIETSEQVLDFLRGELVARHGETVRWTLPVKLTSKQKGMLGHFLADFPETETRKSLIRLLVWDWEESREVCFPKYTQQPYPSVEALVQYRQRLASFVNTGFHRSTSRRGRPNLYADRFLRPKQTEKPSEPLGLPLDLLG